MRTISILQGISAEIMNNTNSEPKWKMKFRSWASKKLMKKLKSYVPVFLTREPITSYIASQPKEMKWRIIPPWIQFSGFCTIHLLFQPKTKKLFITSVNINRYRSSLHRRTYLQGNRSWTGNYQKFISNAYSTWPSLLENKKNVYRVS